MEVREPEFAGQDYVVRYGLRGFRGALFGLLVWTGFAFLVAAHATSPSIPAGIALAMGETGLLVACGVEIWRAARREVIFAVHPDGVYFGSGQVKEYVPWELISAVELFTERGRIRGFRGSYRCVGIRAVDTGRTSEHGAAIRSAYRRMSGWRIDRDRLIGSVQQYAPGLPVIDGQDRSQGV